MSHHGHRHTSGYATASTAVPKRFYATLTGHRTVTKNFFARNADRTIKFCNFAVTCGLALTPTPSQGLRLCMTKQHRNHNPLLKRTNNSALPKGQKNNLKVIYIFLITFTSTFIHTSSPYSSIYEPAAFHPLYSRNGMRQVVRRKSRRKHN